MKNILIEARYNKYDDYGIFVDEDDIHVNYYKDIQEASLFTASIRTDIPETDSKYLYFLSSYASSTHYGKLINEKNIKFRFYKTEQEALYDGIKNIKSAIYRDNLRLDGLVDDETEEDINVLDYEDFTNYKFEICKILINRHSFGSKEEYDKYYKENLYKTSKEDLYDFLLDLVGGYQIQSYTLDGKLYDIRMIDYYRNTDNLSLKSLLGYHTSKFSINDRVKVKDPNFKNAIFRISGQTYQDIGSIYKSEDPLHYREGYSLIFDSDMVDIIYNDYMDDYLYDEDLELVKA